MNKLNLLTLFVVLFIVSACTNDSKPEQVAEKFNKALYKADFEAAKALCTEDSKQAVDFYAAFAADRMSVMKKAGIKYFKKKVEYASNGNYANVEGIVKGCIDLRKGEATDSTFSTLHLIKNNNTWLVIFKIRDEVIATF